MVSVKVNVKMKVHVKVKVSGSNVVMDVYYGASVVIVYHYFNFFSHQDW